MREKGARDGERKIESEREGEQELGVRREGQKGLGPVGFAVGRSSFCPPGARYLSLSGLRGEKGQDFGINNLSESNDRPAGICDGRRLSSHL